MAKRRMGGDDQPSPPPDAPSNNHAPPDKKSPVFKVGPIFCDKSATVETAVWENEVTLADGQTFKAHSVTVHGRYRDEQGEWKDLKSFRGSYLHVLVYCLQRCQDWILAQRDPANSTPF